MYPIATVEPTYRFILEVVKALLEEEVPHQAISRSIARLEVVVVELETHQRDIRRTLDPLIFNANISNNNED